MEKLPGVDHGTKTVLITALRRAKIRPWEYTCSAHTGPGKVFLAQALQLTTMDWEMPLIPFLRSSEVSPESDRLIKAFLFLCEHQMVLEGKKAHVPRKKYLACCKTHSYDICLCYSYLDYPIIKNLISSVTYLYFL